MQRTPSGTGLGRVLRFCMRASGRRTWRLSSAMRYSWALDLSYPIIPQNPYFGGLPDKYGLGGSRLYALKPGSSVVIGTFAGFEVVGENLGFATAEIRSSAVNAVWMGQNGD